jgi:hypothetical protein
MTTRLFIFVPAIVLGSAALIAASLVEPVLVRAVLIVAATGALTALVGRAALILDDTAIFVDGTERRSGADRRDSATVSIESLQDRRKPTLDRDSGLCMNWYFRIRAEDEIARAERYATNFTVVAVHGDETTTMTAAGRALKHMLREVDYAGDLGDYIAIVLPNTGTKGAEVIAARVNATAGLTATRIATFPTDGATLSQLLGEPEWHTSDQMSAA